MSTSGTQKHELYLKFMSETSDDWGFIESSHCDSLLFSGLVGSCKGVTVNIDAAYHELRNEWWRRPVAHPCCYDSKRPINNESLISKLFQIAGMKLAAPSIPLKEIIKPVWWTGSTISRDMLLGLAWYAWHNKRLDISENIIKRALKSFGVMGRGDPMRTNIMPALLSTFAWISYKLGGPSRPWLRLFGPTTGGKLTGYQAHLQVLHILLRKEITGKISKSAKETLTYHRKRQPFNPLFLHADGLSDLALAALKSGVWWPNDRLPTAKDRHEPWLLQRDYGKDWVGSDSDKIHSGGDFVFLYSLITGQMEGRDKI